MKKTKQNRKLQLFLSDNDTNQVRLIAEKFGRKVSEIIRESLAIENKSILLRKDSDQLLPNRIQVYITDECMKDLQNKAIIHNLSISELVRNKVGIIIKKYKTSLQINT